MREDFRRQGGLAIDVGRVDTENPGPWGMLDLPRLTSSIVGVMRNGPDGTWAESIRPLVSYCYLGCSSVAHDADHAEGRMRLRRDMRTPAGLLAAPLGIAALDTAGINVDPVHILSLTRIDVHVLERASDVGEIRVVGRVVRRARTQVFSEARIEDAAQPERVIGLATADWAVMSPTPEGFIYTDPGHGVPDSASLPPLVEAFHGRPRPQRGFELPAVCPAVGSRVLHHGPIQVTLEATALEVAAAKTERDEMRVEHLSTRIVKAGRVGPFITSGEVVAATSDTIACRSELRDQGGNGCLVAVGLARLATAPLR